MVGIAPWLHEGARRLARFWRAVSGGVAVTAAVAFPSLLAVVGISVDYVNLAQDKSRLQSVADSAALAAARELRLGNADPAVVANVARAYVANALAGDAVGFSATVANDKKSITVALETTSETYLVRLIAEDAVKVAVDATAKVVGGAPVCVVGLDEVDNFAIGMLQSARLEASGCAVYSNSPKPAGLFAKQFAQMKAAFICSSGGKAGSGPGSFTPSPQTDCPPLPDPLANRPQPSVGGCTHTNLVVRASAPVLSPGTYCGGLRIDLLAKVTLQPGIYIIKDGPLIVTGGATLAGNGVGFFFTGKGATLKFDVLSNVSLSAPIDGTLAGILFFEDRSVAAGQKHEILSSNARTLLGTIYLSRGEFEVAAIGPVADKSAYTIVVARQFSLAAGPTMVLNTNYGATTVPVPEGLGPNSAKAVLTD